MSEKIFWIQKIQKTQFSFLTTYPFELRKKLLNLSSELVSIKQKATLIDISHQHHINKKFQKEFFEFRKFKKHNLVFSIHIRFNYGINQ